MITPIQMLKHLKEHLVFIILLAVSAGLLVYFSYFNEFCEGGPDNIWHYYFSKYALYYPQFFLHHWGKPVFILLSTWFAQFGFIGIKIFNVLCGLFSTIFAYKILIHLKVPFKWTIVPLLIFSPLYFIVLQSSLTEPLFGLILTIGIFLYLKNNYLLATILLSFLLFSRSEGTFIIFCFAAYLVIMRQWKYLPLFLSGFLIYAIIGVLMGHNFFWYFTENPYQYISPYGHGHFMDILNRYKNIWGSPFTVLLCFSVCVLLFQYIREKQFIFWKPANETARIFYLVFIPALAFTVFHLYAWHYGLYGSAGLERVLACVFPLYAILSSWSINKILLSKFSRTIGFSFLGLFFYFHVQTPFKAISYPLKAFGREKVFIESSAWFKTIMPDSCIIYYADPSAIFQLNKDPFDKYLNREQFAFNLDCNQHESLPVYFFWDSKFSENSCGISTATVEKCEFKKLKEFSDGDSFHLIIYGKPAEIEKK